MGYTGIELDNSLSIGRIFSIHYFEYMSDFSFEGERHDFWEFICVDKGEVLVTADEKTFTLKNKEIAFHKPNEFHTVNATGTIAPNLVVISFACKDKAINFFRDKVFSIDDAEHNLLAEIIIEARHCLASRLDDPYLENMTKKPSKHFASEQLIRMYLEQFLIHLIRRYRNPLPMNKPLPKATITKQNKNKNDTEILNRVIDYYANHLHTHITIDQVCQANLVSRSQLQQIFRDQCNTGVIEYYTIMKINAAKQMIRNNNMTFTQISDYLGYSSIHYFSRQFKKIVGMTPSEYASSIKARAEGHF